MRRQNVLALVVLAAAMTACRTPIENNPIDEMTDWTRAEIAFATAVESVTAAGRAGEISKKGGMRIKPLVDEGNQLLIDAYTVIAATPPDQDPVFEPDAISRLMRLALKITAQLAVEKQALAELKETQ